MGSNQFSCNNTKFVSSMTALKEANQVVLLSLANLSCSAIGIFSPDGCIPDYRNAFF